MRESQPPPAIPAEFLPGGGTSPLRLVSAVVLLALSLAIGYRSDRDPPPAEAVPQPVRESVVAGVELPPLDSSFAGAPLVLSSVSAPGSLEVVKAAGTAGPSRAGERRQASRAASRATVGQGARPRRHHAGVAGREPGATRRAVRTRAQVRAEYLRTREVVAALTGEDSGSAYLMRIAARERAARLKGPARRAR